MKNLKQDQNGFTIIETIIVVAVILILFVAGWFVFGRDNKTASQIILQKQQYIDNSISSLTVRNYDNFGSTLYTKGYITEALYSTTQSLINSYSQGILDSNPAYQNVVCVSEIPTSFKYGNVAFSQNGNAAILSVSLYEPGSSIPVPYSAYWIYANDTWKLNGVNCTVSID